MSITIMAFTAASIRSLSPFTVLPKTMFFFNVRMCDEPEASYCFKQTPLRNNRIPMLNSIKSFENRMQIRDRRMIVLNQLRLS